MKEKRWIETAKSAVNNREAAERYGIDLNAGGKALCPFHEDHHPSLYIGDDHYHCYACGAHGDVVDFTARLFDLSQGQAAKKLASDFGLDAGETNYQTIKPVRQSDADLVAATLARVRLLEGWKRDYAPTTPEAPWDKRFLTACRELEPTRDCLDGLLASSPAEREQAKRFQKEMCR